jgi:hypothetical protein
MRMSISGSRGRHLRVIKPYVHIHLGQIVQLFPSRNLLKKANYCDMEIEIFFAKYDDNNDSTFYTSDVVEALGDIDQKEQEGDENLLDQSR